MLVHVSFSGYDAKSAITASFFFREIGPNSHSMRQAVIPLICVLFSLLFLRTKFCSRYRRDQLYFLFAHASILHRDILFSCRECPTSS